MDAELRNDFADLPNKVGAFICQDSEYKSAKRKVNNGGSFAYHQPLIIAEGSCFLEKTLIKKCLVNEDIITIYRQMVYCRSSLLRQYTSSYRSA